MGLRILANHMILFDCLFWNIRSNQVDQLPNFKSWWWCYNDLKIFARTISFFWYLLGYFKGLGLFGRANFKTSNLIAATWVTFKLQKENHKYLLINSVCLLPISKFWALWVHYVQPAQLLFLVSRWKFVLANFKNRLANNLQNVGMNLKKMQYLGGTTLRTFQGRFEIPISPCQDNTCVVT